MSGEGFVHGLTIEAIERDDRGHATQYLGTCRCQAKFAAATYEAAEDKWRRHVYAEAGTASRYWVTRRTTP